MLSQAVLGISFAIQLLVLGILAWGVCEYIRLRHQLCHMKRRIVTTNIDEVINELLEADDTDTDTKYHHAVAKQTEHQAGPETTHSVSGEAAGNATTVVQQHRERLAGLAAGGWAQQYLGKTLSIDQIDNLEDEEVEKLYGRYEARLGAAMTKPLGAAVLQLYTSTVSIFLLIPPEEQPKLLTELESDPFVEHAVSNAMCELYHKFGMILAQLTTALTTLRHCRFGQQDVPRIVYETDATSYQSDGGRNSADTRVDEGGGARRACGESDSPCTSPSCA